MPPPIRVKPAESRPHIAAEPADRVSPVDTAPELRSDESDPERHTKAPTSFETRGQPLIPTKSRIVQRERSIEGSSSREELFESLIPSSANARALQQAG